MDAKPESRLIPQLEVTSIGSACDMDPRNFKIAVCLVLSILASSSSAIENRGKDIQNWFSDGIGADWERLPDVFMGKLPRLAEVIESNATDFMEAAGSHVEEVAVAPAAQLPDVTDRLRARKVEVQEGGGGATNWKWPPRGGEGPPFHAVIAQPKTTTSTKTSKTGDSQGAGTEHWAREYPEVGYREGKSLDYRHEEEGPKPYHFAYKVKNKYGNHFGQREKSDGDTVTGEYNVLLPDGRYQTVAYWADWKTGYNAQVKYSGQPKHQQQQKVGGHHPHGPSYQHAQGLAEVEQQIWGRPTHSHHVYSGPPKFVEASSKPQEQTRPKLHFKPSKPISTSGPAYQNPVVNRHTQHVPIYRYPDGGAPTVPYVYKGGPSFFKAPPTSASSFSSTTVQEGPNSVATSPTSSYPSSSKYQQGPPYQRPKAPKGHKSKSSKYTKGPPKPTNYPPPGPPVLYRPQQQQQQQGPTAGPYFGYSGPTHGPIGFPQGAYYGYPTAGSFVAQQSLPPAQVHSYGPNPTVEVEMHGGFRPSLPPLQPQTSIPKQPSVAHSFPSVYSSPGTPYAHGQHQTLKNYHQDPKDPSDHSGHSHSHTYDPETGTLVIHHHHGLPNDKETGRSGGQGPTQGSLTKPQVHQQQPLPTPPYRGIAPVQLVHSVESLGTSRSHFGPQGPPPPPQYPSHPYALQQYFINPASALPYGAGPHPPPGYAVDPDPQGTSSIPAAASNPVSVSVPILKQQKTMNQQQKSAAKKASLLLAEFEVHQNVESPSTSTAKTPSTVKPDPGATFFHAVFRSASAEKPFKPRLFPFLTNAAKGGNSTSAYRYSFAAGTKSETSTTMGPAKTTTSTTPNAYAIEPRHPSIRRYRKGKLEGEETSNVDDGYQESEAFVNQQQFDNMQLNRTTPVARHRFKGSAKNAKVVRIR